MASKMYLTPQFFLYQFVTTFNRFKTCLFVGLFFSLLIHSNNRFYFMTLFFIHSFHFIYLCVAPQARLYGPFSPNRISFYSLNHRSHNKYVLHKSGPVKTTNPALTFISPLPAGRCAWRRTASTPLPSMKTHTLNTTG